MANELTLVFETNLPIPFTCADGVGIEKGAVLTLQDPMTASGAAIYQGTVCGIAAEEKVASDGKTKIGVYRGGIFKGIVSGAVTVGDPLAIAVASNTLQTAAVNAEQIFGYSLETATNGETILYELNPTVMQLA